MEEKMKKISKILIVEDDALTALAIKSDLLRMKYGNVDIANSYEEAICLIKAIKYDLLLLDIDLNNGHTGIDIANKKMVLNKIPFIYLTYHTEEPTIGNMLKTHPKGYLSKPLKYEELKVAVAIALGYKKETIDIGNNFNYNKESQNLYLEDKYIKLSKNEKSLLERLIEENGAVVPLNILEFEIWGNEDISKNALRMLIRSLRTKLKPKKIENVLAEGYKIELPK